MGAQFEGDERGKGEEEDAKLRARERTVVEVAPEGAGVAAGLHGHVDALGAFVGTNEEGAHHVADDACLPAPARGAGAGWGGSAGSAGAEHAGGFAGEHCEVTVHEGDDGDHEPREAEPLEPFEEVVKGGGEDEEGGGLDGDPALEEQGREGDEAFAADGEAEETEVEGGERTAGAGEDERDGGDGKGHGDEGATDHGQGADAGHERDDDEGEPGSAQGEVGTLGEEADGEDEGDDEEELQARIGAVERAFAGEVAVEVQAWRLLAVRTAAPRPRVTTKTMPTPMRPAMTTVAHSFSIPGTV